MPADEAAERLCLPESELPPLPASVPGEATVTPLAPRLGAVASGGMGPVGAGGYGPVSGHGGARTPAPGTAVPGMAPPDTGLAATVLTARAATGPRAPPAAAGASGRLTGTPPTPHPTSDPGRNDTFLNRHSDYERTASYAPQPPAAYAQPPAAPQQGNSRHARRSRPPITLSPGHGLVPMWDPPDWNPDPEPVPPATSAPVPSAAARFIRMAATPRRICRRPASQSSTRGPGSRPRERA